MIDTSSRAYYSSLSRACSVSDICSQDVTGISFARVEFVFAILMLDDRPVNGNAIVRALGGGLLKASLDEYEL